MTSQSSNHPPDNASDKAPGRLGGVLEPNVDLERLIYHTALPHTSVSLAIDKVLRAIGSGVSWLWVVLVGVICINVTMRYVFDQGSIPLEELQWHIYAIVFLVGFSYAFESDDHVRVDLLHDRLSLRSQAWVELYGILLALLPFLLVVLYYSVPFIEDAFVTGESSSSPGGLPHRFFIKSFLFIGSALLLIAAISRLTRVSALLFGWPRALKVPLKAHAPNASSDVPLKTADADKE